MTDAAALFTERKPDIERVSEPLFRFAEGQVRKRGAFLPFGATMTMAGNVSPNAAAPEMDVASSADVLPLLHDGLRAAATAEDSVAIAVCEWVKITPEGGRQTDAIKVLVEHRRGLTVALYLPCKSSLLGWRLGDMLVKVAEPEVKPWSDGAA
jgi:hypothetical protein